MNFSRSILLLINIFLLTEYLQAQTPAPSAGIGETRSNSRKVTDDDLINFELELAENGYTINKSPESTNRLLSIYEKVLFLRCLKETYETLKPSQPAQDEICIEFTDKVFNIDPGNVVAYCARDGTDSLTCKEASQSQILKVFDHQKEEKRGTASLEDVIAEKKEGEIIRKKTYELNDKLAQLQNGNKSKKQQLEKRNIMQEIIRINCSRPRIRLQEEVTVPVRGNPEKTGSMIAPDDDSLLDTQVKRPKASPTPDELTEAFNKHFEKPTPKAQVTKSIRSYEISLDCDKYIKQALEIMPNSPPAICAKMGSYSWHCINARRAVPADKSKSQTFTGSAGGIKKF